MSISFSVTAHEQHVIIIIKKDIMNFPILK